MGTDANGCGTEGKAELGIGGRTDMNEVEAVARAIEDQLTVEDGWEVGTTALRNMCIDFAQAAIAALDAVRGDQVARVVAYLRQVSIAEDKRAEGNEGTIYGQCVAYISLALRRAADAIERGEPFNG